MYRKVPCNQQELMQRVIDAVQQLGPDEIRRVTTETVLRRINT